MQDTEQPQTSTPARWSAFGCAGVGCLSYAAFGIAQLIAFAVVLDRAHPDWMAQVMRVPQTTAQQLLAAWTIEVSTASNLLLFAIVGDGVMALVALWLAKEFLGAGLRQLGFWAGEPVAKIALGLGGGVVLVIVANLVGALQTHLFGPHPEAVAKLLKTHHGAADFIFDLASVSVLAPFAEELLFRGVIFRGLAQWLPIGLAAPISGCIFGLAHFDPWNIVPLAVVGTGLALIYNRTGSLLPNTIAHATFNAVGLIAVYAFPQYAT